MDIGAVILDIENLLSTAQKEESTFSRKFEERAKYWIETLVVLRDNKTLLYDIENGASRIRGCPLDMIGVPIDSTKGKADSK